MRTPIVLAAGLVVIATAVGVTLAHSPSTLAGTNSVSDTTDLGNVKQDAGACQSGETLPTGTSAIRLSLSTIVGARVSVSAQSGSQLITSGVRGPFWTGNEVTIPVARVSHRVSRVTVCFGLSALNGVVELLGRRTAPAVAAFDRHGRRLAGRFRTEYLRGGRSSWLSLASSVATRMSLGRGASGIWIDIFVATLVLALIALTSWGVLRELG